MAYCDVCLGKGSALKTVEYLDAVKKHLEIESDYALAPRLDLSRQAISKLRNGQAVMSNTTAARIAALLELDPLRVIADAELERGSDSKLWRQIREALAALVMALGASLLPEPAHALAGFNNNLCAVSPAQGEERPGRGLNMHCVAWWRSLGAWLARCFHMIGGRA